MKRKILSLALAAAMACSLCISAGATDIGVVSYDEETGMTIYRDSEGGLVFSGITGIPEATEEEQQAQLAAIDRYSDELENMQRPVTRSGDYVDYEHNPILIGVWNGVEAYARHTLGDYNKTEKHLTSYGYATFYNTKGYNAVPYRNGNATVAGQAVVDVKKGSYFAIRDLTTNNGKTLQISDWGPNQTQVGNADGRERIADLDKGVFKELHGNTSSGVFYARTWVPIENYNP